MTSAGASSQRQGSDLAGTEDGAPEAGRETHRLRRMISLVTDKNSVRQQAMKAEGTIFHRSSMSPSQPQAEVPT
jgi:hypothetical protein